MHGNHPSTLGAYTFQARSLSGPTKMGDVMTAISVVSMGSADRKTIALFCMVGLVASLCLMTFGVDLGAGWV
jgi:hypothetical protein